MRRVAVGLLALGTALATMVVTGCSGDPRPVGALKVETFHSSGDDRPAMAVGGVLDGEVHGSRACFWFADEEQRRTPIVWAAGISAERDPLRVVDSGGKTIAKLGEAVTLPGGLGRDPDLASECGDGSSVVNAYAPS